MPPVLMYRRGRPVADTWRLILANVRTEESTWGDMQAMYGSLKIGERGVLGLVERHGVDTFARALVEIKDYSECRMRRELASIPDGVFQLDPRSDTDFVFYLYRERDWGGGADGNSAVFGSWSNDRQSSMEANEQAYPIRLGRPRAERRHRLWPAGIGAGWGRACGSACWLRRRGSA